MSERSKAIPTLTEIIENSYSDYVENMAIEKGNEPVLTEKEYIKKLFVVVARYFKKHFNKNNDPKVSQLLKNLADCQTYQPCINSLISIKKIIFGKYPRSMEKTLNSRTDLRKKYDDFVLTYKKCLPQTTFSNLQKLTEHEKIYFNEDADFAGITYLTDSPHNSYISLPDLLFKQMGLSFQVGNRDRNTRYTYFSDGSYNESDTINQEGSKTILDTIVHEYGHLLQYTKFSLHSSLIERSIISNLGDLTTADAKNSQEEDIIVGSHFNENEETRAWTMRPAEVFTRIVESGASYFALDSIVACLQ